MDTSRMSKKVGMEWKLTWRTWQYIKENLVEGTKSENSQSIMMIRYMKDTCIKVNFMDMENFRLRFPHIQESLTMGEDMGKVNSTL